MTVIILILSTYSQKLMQIKTTTLKMFKHLMVFNIDPVVCLIQPLLFKMLRDHYYLSVSIFHDRVKLHRYAVRVRFLITFWPSVLPERLLQLQFELEWAHFC